MVKSLFESSSIHTPLALPSLQHRLPTLSIYHDKIAAESAGLIKLNSVLSVSTSTSPSYSKKNLILMAHV